MKTLTLTLAAAIFAASGATAMANSDSHQAINDVTVVSVDRAAGAVIVDSFGVTKTLDSDPMFGVYVPLDVAPGDTLRLTYEDGLLDSVRPLG